MILYQSHKLYKNTVYQSHVWRDVLLWLYAYTIPVYSWDNIVCNVALISLVILLIMWHFSEWEVLFVPYLHFYSSIEVATKTRDAYWNRVKIIIPAAMMCDWKDFIRFRIIIVNLYRLIIQCNTKFPCFSRVVPTAWWTYM